MKGGQSVESNPMDQLLQERYAWYESVMSNRDSPTPSGVMPNDIQQMLDWLVETGTVDAPGGIELDPGAAEALCSSLNEVLRAVMSRAREHAVLRGSVAIEPKDVAFAACAHNSFLTHTWKAHTFAALEPALPLASPALTARHFRTSPAMTDQQAALQASFGEETAILADLLKYVG